MAKTGRLTESEVYECREVARSFYEKQLKFKKAQDKFNEAKAQFNQAMEKFFNAEDVDKSIIFTYAYDYLTNGELDLKINKVQKTSVEFNTDKLEKVLSKDKAKQVISKQYEITDIDGLVSYLKKCGVDPKIFKSYLNIKKSVDVKALDRLEDLGEIELEEIEGCYKIKVNNPYFTVSVKRGATDDGGDNKQW